MPSSNILTPRFPAFLHGGDYNPDQWLDRPDILERDIEMMHEAHVNCVSIAIFAWTRLEPSDGVYDFAWLDEVIDRLWKGGIHIILATPSGARPAWMAQKYPEVLRVNQHDERAHFGGRENHCLTSPVYRRKVREMDIALAQRYAHHPAVILWHLSNEYLGDCYCPLCQEKFRQWLKKRYGSLESLNHAWWTSFWSHRYTDWSQVEAPGELGETCTNGQWIDWRRFMTHQCKTFMMAERDAVHSVDPSLPCTANLMERFWDYDYFSFAEGMDVVSWDSYPAWHSGDDVATAAEFAMNHDIMRSLKDQPFLLMESTPSKVNWKSINKLKRPGMHLLSSMQAVAHGSQSVCYFQWRKGRGGAEQFHGAVVGHDGRSDTRVFRDVTEVGQALEKLAPLYDTPTENAEVCILFDWSNQWAIHYAQTGQVNNMRYFDSVNMHYRALWEQGVRVDFRDMRACTDLSGYKLVVAPMLFMFRNGIEEKLRDFVAQGGTLLMTYFSGVVDESGLAFLGDAPHGLTDVLGVRATELDAIYPQDEQKIVFPGKASYAVTELCELTETLGAETIAEYGADFYAGMPCLTRHSFGSGIACYLAAKPEQAALNAIYGHMAEALSLRHALTEQLPQGVVATERSGAAFVQNYSGQPQTIALHGTYQELISGETLSGSRKLPVNGVWILKKQ